MEQHEVAFITKMVLDVLQQKNAAEGSGFLVPVGVSARHIPFFFKNSFL